LCDFRDRYLNFYEAAGVGASGSWVKLGTFFALVRELLSLAQRGCCQIISL
jgi:hypothetical protein